MVVWTAQGLWVPDKFSHFPNAYIPLADSFCPSVSVSLLSLNSQISKLGDDKVTFAALQLWWIHTWVRWYLCLWTYACKARMVKFSKTYTSREQRGEKPSKKPSESCSRIDSAMWLDWLNGQLNQSCCPVFHYIKLVSPTDMFHKDDISLIHCVYIREDHMYYTVNPSSPSY